MRVLKFEQDIISLAIEKLSNLRVLVLADFAEDFLNKFKFYGGAHKLYIIEGRKTDFQSMDEFFFHVRAIPFSHLTHFQLPVTFCDHSFDLKELNRDEFIENMKFVSNAFYSYNRRSRHEEIIGNIEIYLNDFVNGFKVDTKFVDQLYIAELRQYYLWINLVSID